MKIGDFQGFFSCLSGTLVRFSIKGDIMALTFTKSLCLVLLRPAEASLMLWLYRRGYIFTLKDQGVFCNVKD